LNGYGFTPREAGIVLLTIHGLSNKQIARLKNRVASPTPFRVNLWGVSISVR
jgi:hypothetical protein